MENPEFLKRKYNLHASPEAESAAERTERRTGEKVPQKPAAKIQNYLDRFKEITDREDPAERKRGITALKTVLHNKFVMKPGQIPQSYYDLQGEIAVREGRQADLEQAGVDITTETVTNKEGEERKVRHYTFPEELKEQHDAVAINNQSRSLDKWVDYLSSEDAQYPDWAKYWALRSVLNMGKFEKVKDEDGEVAGARFNKRILPETDPGTGSLKNNPTVASYPLLNPRALALTIGAMRERLEEKSKPKKERQVTNQSTKLSDADYRQLLTTEDFSKLYAQFLIELPEYSPEKLQVTDGAWVKFPQDSDPMTYKPTIVHEGEEYTGQPLVPSLENYPLEWCTADPDTARTQLEGGDFHIYYSVNDLNEPVIPRLAIRMEGDRIAEPPRGIAPDQNLDPYIAPVLEEKLQEFGAEGEFYKKRVEDMRRLTAVEEKAKAGDKLTKEELIFLYEIETPVEGFGYQRDPRIDELITERNTDKDYLIISGHILDNPESFSEEIQSRARDTLRLEEVWTKEDLTKDDLIFLYEIDSSIKGFWSDWHNPYIRDPRIEELRKTREEHEDLPILFECSPDQIVRNMDEINERTKVYIGEISDFTRLKSNLEHIYTFFPYRKVRMEKITMGGDSPHELKQELEQNNVEIDKRALDILEGSDLERLSGTERQNEIITVEVMAMDLGFGTYPHNGTTSMIHQRAQERGLDLLPVDAAPYYALQHKDIPEGTQRRFGMPSVAGSDGRGWIFAVKKENSVCQLTSYVVTDKDGQHDSGTRFGGDDTFIFRQAETEKDSGK